MSNRVTLNKRMIIMLIALLILLLVFVIAMAVVLYNNPIDKAIRRIYNDKKENAISVMPINVASAFPEYSGDVEQLAIYNALEYFASDTVAKYMKELRGKDVAGIETYFNLNKKDIEKELRIESAEEFKTFATEVQKLTGDSLKLTKWTINPNTVMTRGRNVEFVMIMEYENNVKIAFKMNVLADKDETMVPIKYTGGVNEEHKNYEYQPPESVNYYNDEFKPMGRVQ
ncbi:MAG: hypothetical protein IKJ36_03650 [Clostridia bacterium]|nr:hypothetical protein [Clostridia bacterium]